MGEDWEPSVRPAAGNCDDPLSVDLNVDGNEGDDAFVGAPSEGFGGGLPAPTATTTSFRCADDIEASAPQLRLSMRSSSD